MVPLKLRVINPISELIYVFTNNNSGKKKNLNTEDLKFNPMRNFQLLKKTCVKNLPQALHYNTRFGFKKRKKERKERNEQSQTRHQNLLSTLH